MNCIDCIHYESCKDWAHIYYYGTDNPFPYECEQDEKLCDHYKNKADFAEVKYGYIIEHPGHEDECYCECSVCKSKEICIDDKFCSECGAKMDGKER